MNNRPRRFLGKISYLCKYPFSGCMINAGGSISLCCHSQYFKFANLSDIDDLESFYNDSEFFENVREHFDNNLWHKLQECQPCFLKEDNGISSGRLSFSKSDFINDALFESEWNDWVHGKRRQMRFLELATSNLCNQQCATCSSFFSSRWQQLDEKFGRIVYKTQVLSEESLGKVLRILPSLKLLILKGGEPFADPNNLVILKELFDCNDECFVSIVSNMKNIPFSWFDTLVKGKNKILLGASIDGINEVYNWIRGSKFEQTVETIDSFYEATQRKMSINICVSVYNLYSISSIVERFIEHPAINVILIDNITLHPKHVSITSLPSEIGIKALIEQTERIKKIIADHPHTHVRVNMQQLQNFIEQKGVWNKKPESIKNIISELERMNEVRGFNLLDHDTSLRDALSLCP